MNKIFRINKDELLIQHAILRRMRLCPLGVFFRRADAGWQSQREGHDGIVNRLIQGRRYAPRSTIPVLRPLRTVFLLFG